MVKLDQTQRFKTAPNASSTPSDVSRDRSRERVDDNTSHDILGFIDHDRRRESANGVLNAIGAPRGASPRTSSWRRRAHVASEGEGRATERMTTKSLREFCCISFDALRPASGVASDITSSTRAPIAWARSRPRVEILDVPCPWNGSIAPTRRRTLAREHP